MIEIEEKDVGVVVLAAGASERLGSPKQLIRFEDKTLIERAANAAVSTGFETIIVLGANAVRISKEINNFANKILINDDWKSGLSSSIGAGLTKLLEVKPNLSAVILMLCDQPFVSRETLLRLVDKQCRMKSSIVACEYANTIGTPALFVREVFEELLDLKGDEGAKSITKRYQSSKLHTISVPEAAIDIDTKEDYKNLK